MKCEYCGYEIPEGMLYCESCGREVRIVPDYNPLDDMLTEQIRGAINGEDDYIDYGHYRNKAVYLAEIRSINHLDEHSIITPGQLLIIPYYSNVFLR